jgi:hypothetical protein
MLWYPLNLRKKFQGNFQLNFMTLKGHKNLIAISATAGSLPCWQLRATASFGSNPNTTAMSMLRTRMQFDGIVEGLAGEYRLERQQ